MPETVAQDIKESKKQESVNLRMTDGKIICDFSISDNSKEDWEMRYINYQKVFDTWTDFTDYSKEFFKSK